MSPVLIKVISIALELFCKFFLLLDLRVSWELFTGYIPFSTYRNELSMVADIIATDARPSPMPSSPKGISELISEMWQKAMDKRPSANLVLKRLSAMQEYAKGEGIIIRDFSHLQR